MQHSTRVRRTARNVLTARQIQIAKRPGQFADGGGLYLQVQAVNGSQLGKSWLFRYTSPVTQRRREMGLGAVADITLAEARAAASDLRRAVREGLDPLEERRKRIEEARLAASRSITFEKACTDYIEAHAPGWRNAKHKSQWENTLATYAQPRLGKLLVSDIETDHVLKVLEPIWNTKRETARRLRSRLERIFSWAATRRFRSGDNPARWDGNLKDLLPQKSRAAPVRHHPALPYDDLGAFMALLAEERALAARALEFTILTAARTNEVVAACWEEINFERKEWVVPAERMKMGRPHRVPLSEPALAILRGLRGERGYVFPGLKRGQHLSNMAMLGVLKRMDRRDITVHGFRSTFRDWAAEQTGYPDHVVEMALAHQISDKVEAAYRRGDLIEKRTRLMDEWATFALSPKKAGTVTPIRRADHA